MKRAPWFWLIAGPNGAGKSTTAREFLPRLERIVNPDDLVLRRSAGFSVGESLRAGREAVILTTRLIVEGRDFARETTLSGHSIVALIDRAKSAGYRIGIIYIGLASPELAIARVRQRRAEGGHDVPVADIRRRYQRSLRNLPGVIAKVHRAVLLDNSSRRLRARKIIEVVNGATVYRRSKLPGWVPNALRLTRILSKKTR